MKLTTLNSRAKTLAAIAAVTLMVQGTAVSAAVSRQSAAAPEKTIVSAAVSGKVFNEYEAILKSEGRIPAAIRYLNEHIDEVSKQQATIMTLHLENAIVNAHAAFERRFESNSVQAQINRVYKPGDSFSSVIKRTNDRSLKSLLIQAGANGYKLETAEGFYFPVINYSIFRMYKPYVAADISAYIDIMAAETGKASVKDAAILIGYQELSNRALSQELFLQKYPVSNRAARVKDLFHNYRIMTFYGTNNTPLFDYENNTMNANAKLAYSAILERNKGRASAYLNLLGKFMTLAADTKYERTADMEKFLKTNVPIN